jgi:diguanylate cyclase (GGDEF)-like protein
MPSVFLFSRHCLSLQGGQLKDPSRTNQELLKEISILKQKIKELEHSESGRKQAEEALQRSVKEAFRLAKENEIVAVIGRVISSTISIEEIYKAFSEKVREVISFDRIVINLIDPEKSSVSCQYHEGIFVSGRQGGDILPSEGTATEQIRRTGKGFIIQSESAIEIGKEYPGLLPELQHGIRSFLTVPLISKDHVIGGLALRSTKSGAYTDRDLRLAGNIANQIAGAISNAQLFIERRRIEEALRDSENRYRELSIIDDLTQLYNSRHFYFQLKIELDRSNRYEQPLTLLLLDLDNFKAFNDAYGHVEGDQVLLRLGQVVKRCLRETDFAYRYGGEEFTILLPMTTSADGAVTAERIRTEFKKELFSPAPGQDVHVTVSIGIAQYKTQEEMKAFVHRVDQLMYQGKKNGKDRVCSES